MKVSEKMIQSLFSKKNTVPGVFELKLVKLEKVKTLGFSKVEPHQIRALLAANSDKGCAHKLSDMSMDKKPWDCQRIANYPAFVVPVYWKPGKPKVAYYVPIKSFVATVHPGEGLSEDQAKQLAEFTITL